MRAAAALQIFNVHAFDLQAVALPSFQTRNSTGRRTFQLHAFETFIFMKLELFAKSRTFMPFKLSLLNFDRNGPVFGLCVGEQEVTQA